MSRRRGVALIELIAACLIFAVAMGAMLQAWRLCFSLSAQGREQALASQIARAELEMSKIQGFNNLPLGTLVNGSDPYTGKWTDPAKYYDIDGLELASTAPASARAFSCVRTGRDYGVLKASSGNTYTLASTTLRSVVVRVYRLADNSQLVRMGVHLTRGGV
jgi:hypothetical protein